jgi:hypothetical protein
MMKFKSTLIVISSLTMLIILLSASLPQQPKWKNLKILSNDLTQFEMNKIMDKYEQALGVKCNFCHVMDKETGVHNYESDARPEKEMARRMMLLTKDINQKHFNYNNKEVAPQTITCYTCHNGKTIPDWEKPKDKKAKFF